MFFSDARFEDRTAAARDLARRLSRYAGQDPLVLAIPRGAVPMGAVLADALDGDLDVVLVHKLGAPYQPEYAIGSVDETGRIEVRDPSFDETWVRKEAARQLEVLRRRRASYGAELERQDPAGRVVIVVDDGVATGATMRAALRAVRAQGPSRLIAAVAVAPPDTASLLRQEADELVILATPPNFAAVGQFFADFAQVEDAEVVAHLRAARARRGATR
ncbi:MAG: phosphoribosyltransferase [Planctomycetota bacterium]